MQSDVPRRFEVVGKIVLGFIHKGEQVDALIGDGVVELKGGVVIYHSPEGTSCESITTSNIIDVSLEHGRIKEIKNHETLLSRRREAGECGTESSRPDAGGAGRFL
jgi:hypothetical protein